MREQERVRSRNSEERPVIIRDSGIGSNLVMRVLFLNRPPKAISAASSVAVFQATIGRALLNSLCEGRIASSCATATRKLASDVPNGYGLPLVRGMFKAETQQMTETQMQIVVVCGTNREGALSRLLAEETAETYRRLGQSVDLLDMKELPPEILQSTAYKDQPATVAALVARFLKSDGAVFIIPEYNGSYPGIVKLFVDMLPYPEGFDSRPCAFVGLAAGQFKSLRAVEHFQQVAGYRNAYLYPRRLFIGDSFKQFVDGKLADDELSKQLGEQAEGFLKFIESLKT